MNTKFKSNIIKLTTEWLSSTLANCLKSKWSQKIHTSTSVAVQLSGSFLQWFWHDQRMAASLPIKLYRIPTHGKRDQGRSWCNPVAAPETFLWGGIEGVKCISEGKKIQKNCRKWLIFAIFSFWWEGEQNAPMPSSHAITDAIRSRFRHSPWVVFGQGSDSCQRLQNRVAFPTSWQQVQIAWWCLGGVLVGFHAIPFTKV